MNYVTNYYKNLSEQLQEKVNVLQHKLQCLNEGDAPIANPSGIPPTGIDPGMFDPKLKPPFEYYPLDTPNVVNDPLNYGPPKETTAHDGDLWTDLDGGIWRFEPSGTGWGQWRLLYPPKNPPPGYPSVGQRYKRPLLPPRY